VTVRVYLEGTGKGEAVTAFQQLANTVLARKLRVWVEDPVALSNGAGHFFIDVKHANTLDDAVAVVRATLDQVPGAAAAFELSVAQD
jgi:hypothetical protein